MAILQKKTEQPTVGQRAAKGMPLPGIQKKTGQPTVDQRAAKGMPLPGKKLDVHELNQLIRWARIFMQITVISMIISIFVGIIALLDFLG